MDNLFYWFSKLIWLFVSPDSPAPDLVRSRLFAFLAWVNGLGSTVVGFAIGCVAGDWVVSDGGVVALSIGE